MLEKVVQEQIEEAIVYFLSWKEGTFSFELSTILGRGEVSVDPHAFILEKGIDTQWLVLEGTRMMDEQKQGGEIPVEDTVADAFIEDDGAGFEEPPAPESQGGIVLVDDDLKAVAEIYRVLKPDGYLGSLELGWFKAPSKDIYNEILRKTCSNFVPRMLLFNEWESFFKSHKFELIKDHIDRDGLHAEMMNLVSTLFLITVYTATVRLNSGDMITDRFNPERIGRATDNKHRRCGAGCNMCSAGIIANDQTRILTKRNQIDDFRLSGQVD